MVSELHSMGPRLFDSGEAREILLAGGKVARLGWNGKNMFLYYVPAASYDALTDIAKKEFGEKVPYRAYIAHKATDGIVGPFTITNTDFLAEDWFEVV